MSKESMMHLSEVTSLSSTFTYLLVHGGLSRKKFRQLIFKAKVAPTSDWERIILILHTADNIKLLLEDGKTEIPKRIKARAPSFNNLSVLPEISRGVLIADLIAILGSIDIVLGEVDR